MNNYEENTKKAMELIQKKKEYISEQKTKISIAEGRRVDNLNAIEELKKEVKELGFDPENIEEEIKKLENSIKEENKELSDIILELENEI